MNILLYNIINYCAVGEVPYQDFMKQVKSVRFKKAYEEMQKRNLEQIKEK